MGADGSIAIAKREDFEKANPGVNPQHLNLYSGKVLGVDAVWGYRGDNLDEPVHLTPWSEDKRVYDDGFREANEAELKAIEWFSDNAEWHEVWT